MTRTVQICGVDVALVNGMIPRVWEYERLRTRDALWLLDDRWECREAIVRGVIRRGNAWRWS